MDFDETPLPELDDKSQSAEAPTSSTDVPNEYDNTQDSYTYFPPVEVPQKMNLKRATRHWHTGSPQKHIIAMCLGQQVYESRVERFSIESL